MILEKWSLITLDNDDNKKYVVTETLELNDNKYVVIVHETNLEDVKFCKEELENDQLKLTVVKDIEEQALLLQKYAELHPEA